MKQGALTCHQCQEEIEYPDNFCATCGSSSVVQLLWYLHSLHTQSGNAVEATDVAMQLADLSHSKKDEEGVKYWLARALETDPSNDMAGRWASGKDIPDLTWRRKVWSMKYAPTVLWRVVLERLGLWPPPLPSAKIQPPTPPKDWAPPVMVLPDVVPPVEQEDITETTQSIKVPPLTPPPAADPLSTPRPMPLMPPPAPPEPTPAAAPPTATPMPAPAAPSGPDSEPHKPEHHRLLRGHKHGSSATHEPMGLKSETLKTSSPMADPSYLATASKPLVKPPEPQTIPPPAPAPPDTPEPEAKKDEARPGSIQVPEAVPAPKATVEKTGSNVILNVPKRMKEEKVAAVGPRLTIIYGNFAPNDPRDVGFYGLEGDSRPVRLLFGRGSADTVDQVQLNHYTVHPEAHAELVLSSGDALLVVSRINKGQENRFEIRVNGVPVPPKEARRVSPGDMVTLGIFRLRWVPPSGSKGPTG